MFVQLGFLRLAKNQNKSSEGIAEIQQNEITSEYYEVCSVTHTHDNDLSRSNEEFTEKKEIISNSPSHNSKDTNWIYLNEDAFDTDSVISSVRDRKEKELQVRQVYVF